MAKSINDITDIIVDFVNARGWYDQDPNQLVTSIFVELGELAEHYQWKSEFWEMSEDEKTEVGYEFVDVINYLFRLARNSGIDIEKYFDEKMPKLAKKFPIGGDSEKSHKEYRATGKNKKYE